MIGIVVNLFLIIITVLICNVCNVTSDWVALFIYAGLAVGTIALTEMLGE